MISIIDELKVYPVVLADVIATGCIITNSKSVGGLFLKCVCTVILPVLALSGTNTVKAVDVACVIVASIPPIVTLFSFVLLLKFVPSIIIVWMCGFFALQIED